MSGVADISVCDGDPNFFEASLGRPAEEKHGQIIPAPPAADGRSG
jgi:coenzyme F420 hydrogenase subunit beta